MKRRTSWPWSRKYSAIVRPERPTRRRAPGRLVHLAVDERDLVDHARLGHLEHEVVALARALADAGEDGDAAVLLGEVVDQLLDQDGLADAGAAEQADLAALDVRRDQVDALEAGLEDLDLRREVAEGGRIAVDRPALGVGRRARPCRRSPARSRSRGVRASARPTGTEIGCAGVDDVDAARESVGRVHRDRADAVVAEVLLHLGHERARLGSSISSAVRISGRRSGKTASMTTPLISMILPVFRLDCSGIGLSSNDASCHPHVSAGAPLRVGCESSSGSRAASCQRRLNPPGYPVDPAPRAAVLRAFW